MYIKKLIIQNYKIFKDAEIFEFNKNKNIFIGDNGSGKSCILESIEIVTNNTINESSLKYNLKPSLFNKHITQQYEKILKEFYYYIDELIKIEEDTEYIEKLYLILDQQEYSIGESIICEEQMNLKELIEYILEGKKNREDSLSKDLEEIINLIINEGLTLKELNDDYFMSQKLVFFIMKAKIFTTPEIVIEAYLDDVKEEFKNIKGGNNSEEDSTYGIKTKIFLPEENRDDYYNLLVYNRILHIPVYLYSIRREYFNYKSVYKNPFKVGVINTLTNKNGGINRILGRNINSLSSQREKIEVNASYLSKISEFNTSTGLAVVNRNLETIYKKIDKNLEITIKERNQDDWFKELTLYNDNILFENLGYGEQNYINILMSLYYPKSDINILIIEEPENSLSFSNMNMLLSKISEIENIQVFISTHSNYIANKLGLNNVQILNNDGNFNHKGLFSLKREDKDFFNKIPGYDTLRILLSKKIVLVEGRSDDLIVQRCYYDKYNKLPIEDGIDIISVEGLSFKRFCRLCDGINKDIYIVTDNDGVEKEKVLQNFLDFENSVLVFVEEDETLKTLEPSVLEVNYDGCDGENFTKFKNIIYKNKSDQKNKSDVCNTMTRNKSEWAYKVYISDYKINYPKYIRELIDKLGEDNEEKSS